MRSFTLTALLLVLTAGCDWPWPLEGTYDQKRCDDPCSYCYEGECQDGKDGGVKPRPKAEPFGKDVDILFVIDNSQSMKLAQKAVANGISNFVEALRTPALGNKIPNVHIGVVSTDLGTGTWKLPGCETIGGDAGKLFSKAQHSGCVPPSKPYIEYIDGVTNINNSAISDPIEKVKAAFKCIVELGTDGCAFEQPIEAARLAVDPAKNRNPGFIRPSAPLVIIFVTDEDDCSAKGTALFNGNQTKVSDPLGPLNSFRCFEFGVTCDINDRTAGPRSSCKPKTGSNYLYDIETYDNFFLNLKNKGGYVLMFALAGPTNSVQVILQSGFPNLDYSCKSTSTTDGVPAIRLEALVTLYDSQEHFNPAGTNICSASFNSALNRIGKIISGRIKWPP